MVMNKEGVPGLRIFLYTMLDLILHGKSETCTDVETLLSHDIASKMYMSYTSFFEQNGFHRDNIPQIDEYYKQWSGVADYQEMRKYSFKADDGLALIIKLALNEIF